MFTRPLMAKGVMASVTLAWLRLCCKRLCYCCYCCYFSPYLRMCYYYWNEWIEWIEWIVDRTSGINNRGLLSS